MYVVGLLTGAVVLGILHLDLHLCSNVTVCMVLKKYRKYLPSGGGEVQTF